MIRTGLDSLLSDPSPLAGRRYGLLANSAARSSELAPIHLALLAAGGHPPEVLFGPEHGFHGVEQDMVASEDERDPWTDLPIVSLYGDSARSLTPAADRFADLDLLVIDLQDVGTRYYTYAASALWAARVALGCSCEVWLLDRPNPLGGTVIEGNLPRTGLESFVGAFRVPVRHGLTLGELARLEAKRSSWPAGLRIWEVEGWRRQQIWSDLDRHWVPPSPNLPTFEAALVYPGICLVEATELSEGRGTTRPFQLVGSPGLSAMGLADELESLDLPGLAFLPALFRPQYQKHAGRLCGGVEIRVTNARAVRPYRSGVELLRAVARVAPEELIWRRQPYEFVTDHPAVDLLTGDSELRHCLQEGRSPASWIASWEADEREFRRESDSILLYPTAGR